MPDQHLLRFLRARDFDPSKALAMMKSDLQWRRQFEGVTFRHSDFPSTFNFFPSGTLYRAGYDLDGRPVLVAVLSKFFPREVTDMGEIPKFWVSYVHRLSQECDERGMTDYTIVADLAGFSPSKNFSLAFVKVLIDILQKYYPERLAYALVLHTPMGFKMLWNMIAPFLEERTKAKVNILGNDVKGLQRYIAKDVLEEAFGGTHAPYPLPDHIAATLASEEGITVNTGYFDDDAPLAPAITTSAVPAAVAKPIGKKSSTARLRTMLKGLRVKEPKVLAPVMDQPLVTANEVPKNGLRATVFGSTGRTGQLVVRKALEAGYDVCVFVRLDGAGIPARFIEFQDKFGKDKLQIVTGNMDDANDLDRAIETSDCVLSCIGVSPNLNVDSDFFQDSYEAIVESMERNGVHRLVAVSAAQANRMSVAWYDANASWLENGNRAMYWQMHYKYVAAMERLVSQNGEIDYTFIRPVILDDNLDNKTESYEVEAETFFMNGKSGLLLSRTALATFMVAECMVNNKFVRQGVAIASQ
ncbi:hypothetical protein BASA81_005818 [Batrachochytrium salamandrivorans]|nr:hypothetical protein BASA81_005818 [Batrachochytrium salamandrivorans]